MSRSWFEDRDGTYFRNSNCVDRDMERARLRPWLWWTLPGLRREWWEVFREGVVQTDKIGRFDRVLEPKAFREAYPNHPGLWVLDERDPYRGQRRPGAEPKRFPPPPLPPSRP